MRILIAEDELLERKAMKKFIEHNFNNMVVVGEAVNGRKAIELAAATCPDIIFMDIKMPGINGLEAIKEINTANPAIKFILVSAYDSFDYAKEAMQYGIKDYILKPGKKEEIVKSLLRLQQEIETENREKQQATALLQEQFMTNAIKDPGSEALNDLLHTLFPQMRSGCFLVVKSEASVDIDTIKKVIDLTHIVKQQADMTVICILSDIKLEKSDVLNMARKLQIQLGVAMYVGIGFPSVSLEKLPQSYQEAYTASLQLAAAQKRHYGFRQESNKQHTTIQLELAYFVEKGQGEEAINFYKKHKERLTESEKEDIYMMVKNILTTRDIAVPVNAFKSLETDQDWQDYLQLCCMKMKAFYQSKQYINQAKAYIHQHFEQAMTLEDVADTVGLSPNYFSNMFKQEFGATFIDYLTEVRLQKAKQLLEENELSLKEISYLIGYKDPNYFSRVFKKHYHESPKHFQQTIFKK
ncbi:two-component system response regulator YesN [Virgibacillus halotolerans]|uniref:response regulator n=1 Tax=Virgibacillus halotolerans TaxID=1071053 RepID=UPI001960DA0D|nr:response regulator [Virgibacillus halotolerans]MBM7599957.1 two-component system response regulator YesN [Virgibacillus halotolerans]